MLGVGFMMAPPKWRLKNNCWVLPRREKKIKSGYTMDLFIAVSNWKGNSVSWEEQGDSSPLAIAFLLFFLSFFPSLHSLLFLPLFLCLSAIDHFGSPSSSAILLSRKEKDKERFDLLPLLAEWWRRQSTMMLLVSVPRPLRRRFARLTMLRFSNLIFCSSTPHIGFIIFFLKKFIMLTFYSIPYESELKVARESKRGSSWWNPLPSLKDLSISCITSINLWLCSFLCSVWRCFSWHYKDQILTSVQAKQVHPDKNPNDPRAAESFQVDETLSDPLCLWYWLQLSVRLLVNRSQNAFSVHLNLADTHFWNFPSVTVSTA